MFDTDTPNIVMCFCDHLTNFACLVVSILMIDNYNSFYFTTCNLLLLTLHYRIFLHVLEVMNLLQKSKRLPWNLFLILE